MQDRGKAQIMGAMTWIDIMRENRDMTDLYPMQTDFQFVDLNDNN